MSQTKEARSANAIEARLDRERRSVYRLAYASVVIDFQAARLKPTSEDIDALCAVLARMARDAVDVPA